MWNIIPKEKYLVFCAFSLAALYHSPQALAQERWQAIIERKCAEEWVADLHMRALCAEHQLRSLDVLEKPVFDENRREIRARCAANWPGDLYRRVICERQQPGGF